MKLCVFSLWQLVWHEESTSLSKRNTTKLKRVHRVVSITLIAFNMKSCYGATVSHATHHLYVFPYSKCNLEAHKCPQPLLCGEAASLSPRQLRSLRKNYKGAITMLVLMMPITSSSVFGSFGMGVGLANQPALLGFEKPLWHLPACGEYELCSCAVSWKIERLQYLRLVSRMEEDGVKWLFLSAFSFPQAFFFIYIHLIFLLIMQTTCTLLHLALLLPNLTMIWLHGCAYNEAINVFSKAQGIKAEYRRMHYPCVYCTFCTILSQDVTEVWSANEARGTLWPPQLSQSSQ